MKAMNKQLGPSKKKATRQNLQQFDHARMKDTSILHAWKENEQKENGSRNTAPLHFGKCKSHVYGFYEGGINYKFGTLEHLLTSSDETDLSSRVEM